MKHHKHIFLIASMLLLNFNSIAQTKLPPVTVAELTLKIGALSTEILYYGFAKGDQIIFDFEEINGKPLKEIEIIELPTNSKFMDFKASKIQEKKINVTKKAIYGFGFRNSTMSSRICKVKIQRVPINENWIDFNTNWEWKTMYDTIYSPYTIDSLLGYDTIYKQKSKRTLVQVDTIVTELFNKVERVHSYLNTKHSQYANLNVQLPNNLYYPSRIIPYESTEIIAWSYWIGVGAKSHEEYNRANRNISNGISAIGALTGYGALASLAISGVSIFRTPSSGDNVGYKFKYKKNDLITIFDSGNGISAIGRNTKLLQGGFTIELYNDNTVDPIDVTVKMVCIQIHKVWNDIPYNKMITTPRYITLNKQHIQVNTVKTRVNSN